MTADVTRWPAPPHVRGTAFLVPGTGYTADMPLLYGSRLVLAELGYHVISIAWPRDRDRDQDGLGLVSQGLDRAREIGGREPDLVVAKSLGCLSAEILPAVPHVLMTPILEPGHGASLVDARAGAHGGLAIGGGRDPFWSADAARARGFEPLEIPGAGHTLDIDGSWRASLDGQRQIMDAVERFSAGLLQSQ